MERRELLAVIGIVAVILVVVAVVMNQWMITPEGPEEPGKIRIGLNAHISGAVPLVGEYMRRGATLAVEEINEMGGVLPAGDDENRTFDLIVVDDATEASRTIDSINKLVYDYNVFAVMGPDLTGCTYPSLFVCNDARVPQFVSAVYPKITEDQLSTTVVRLRASMGAQVYKCVDYFVEERGMEDICLAYVGVEYGQTGLRLARERLSQLGMEPVLEVSHSLGDTDLSPSAIKIMEANPEVVITLAHTTEGALLWQELQKLGYEGEVANTESPEIQIEMMGEDANGLISYVGWMTIDESERGQEFIEAYRDRFNSDPDVHSQCYYSGVYYLKWAIEQVGLDQEEVINLIRNYEGAWEGVGTTYRPKEMGEKYWVGEMCETIMIAQIIDGEIVLLKHYK